MSTGGVRSGAFATLTVTASVELFSSHTPRSVVLYSLGTCQEWSSTAGAESRCERGCACWALAW
jgi:hypothetical protein